MDRQQQHEVARRINQFFSDREYLSNATILAPMMRSVGSSEGWVPLSRLCRLPYFREIFDSMDDVESSILIVDALSKHNSIYVELDDARVSERHIRRLKPKDRIVNTIHFWFSDENYSRDLYLQQLADRRNNSVSIRNLLSFKTLKSCFDTDFQNSSLDGRISIVVDYLSSSPEVDVIYDANIDIGIRRKPLAVRVRLAVEALLCEERDRHLQTLAAELDGWLLLTDIAAHPRITRICQRQPSALANVLQQSALLELSPDRASVRRLAPATAAPDPEWLPDAPSAPPADDAGAFMGPMLVPAGDGATFSVVQFNCLAAFLASPYEMPYAAPRVLAWPYRRRLLLAGLARCAADVVCLQVPRAQGGCV